MTDVLNPADANEPDLVDRIFDYLLQEIPGFADAVRTSRLAEMKNAVRAEFEGDRQRISPRNAAARRDQAVQVLSLFNGRNASEVGRRLGISRATVYRVLKQAGPEKQSRPGSL